MTVAWKRKSRWSSWSNCCGKYIHVTDAQPRLNSSVSKHFGYMSFDLQSHSIQCRTWKAPVHILCNITLPCIAVRGWCLDCGHTGTQPASLLILRKSKKSTSTPDHESISSAKCRLRLHLLPLSQMRADRTRIHRYVKVNGQLKDVSWLYKRAGPTVTFPSDVVNTLPEIDLVVHDLQSSDRKSDFWRHSTLLRHGSDACV